MLRPTLPRCAAIVAAALLLTTACGGGSSAPKSGKAPSSLSHTLTVAATTDPLTLDNQATTIIASTNISWQIVEPLVQYNYTTKAYDPDLATSWKQLNATTLQFKLRKGVTFTDGEPFDASVVKYSIERLQNPSFATPAKIWVSTITGVKVVNKNTVDIISNPASPLTLLYLTKVAMLPPQYIQNHGDAYYGLHPIGTGPFKLSQWVKDDHVTLVANPHYWNGEPSIHKLVFQIIPEASTRLEALQSGQVGMIELGSPDDVSSVKSAGMNVVKVNSLLDVSIQFNWLKGGPVANKDVRLALNYAVNKKALVKNLLDGYGQVSQGQPPTGPYIGFDPNIKAFTYNPTKAKALLAQAGYGPGHPLSLTVYGTDGSKVDDKQTLEAVVQDLTNVGVNAQAQILETGIYTKRITTHGLAPANYAADAPPPDAGVLEEFLLTCEGGFSSYCNSQVTNLIHKANTTVDTTARQAIFDQIATILHQDPPWIYLYGMDDLYGVSPKVNGFSPTPADTYLFDKVTVSK